VDSGSFDLLILLGSVRSEQPTPAGLSFQLLVRTFDKRAGSFDA
jgi:hypothetical protein